MSAYSALGKGEITVIGTKANPRGTGGWSQLTEIQENKLSALGGFWINDEEIRGSAGFYTEKDNFAPKIILLGSQKGKSQFFSLWFIAKYSPKSNS